MVALKTERSIFLWRVCPHPLPKDAPVDVTLNDITAHLKDAFENQRAFAHVNADGALVAEDQAEDAKNCIYIADFKPNQKGTALALLINRGDPDVAHPSFINPVRGTVKNVPPGRDEVQGWSAHLVISTTADTLGRHRAAFESMPNVSSTLVQKYIDALIDKITAGDERYVYQKPIKKGKKTVTVDRTYRLRLGINKVPSESLEKDIEQGVLTAVTLIRTKPHYSGPGDPTVLKSVKEQVTLRVKDVESGRIMDFARRIAVWGKEQQYNEIQFRIDSLPGKRSSSPRFDLEKADAMDTLYARSKRLNGFKALLETCYSEVNKEIAARMLAELNDDTNW